MVRIAIVEDDKNYTEVLKKYIVRYERESNQTFQTIIFQDGEDILENYSAEYDIILMDIEMQFKDGMSTAEEIRKADNEVVIIFITNMPQYAMKGYAVEALDYVLKPINYYAFSQRIDRALSRMKKRTSKFLSVAYKGKMRKMDVSEIYYIEVRNHDLIFHLKNEAFHTRGTMKEIEAELEKDSFFRCNKCYLVNMKYVNAIEENTVLVGTDHVQVSRARKKEFLDVLNDYMNEVSK